MAASRSVERRIVTVLFADLVGFTTLSEQLDSEDVAIVQDAYFDAVRETISRHGGQLEKFIGDAAMAVFGAPRSRDDDAERAVRAGLALVSAVERLAGTLGLDDGALRLRVGINSGETLYGEATAERGPVTGDIVNVAARLQAAAEPGTVVVGELTALSVADSVRLEPLQPLALKGKSEPVRASRASGFYPERSRERALGSLRAPMLGRAAELERLGRAVGDGARLVLVVAPPGVGKSRLLAELEARAAERGAQVLKARLRPDALGPYEPIAQLVEAAGGRDKDVLREHARHLAPGRAEALVDAIGTLFASAAATPDEVQQERGSLFTAWRESLDALARLRPSVWLVEDVHWASPDLLAFLEASRHEARAEGRLVVATARPLLLETAPAWCADADVLDLAPLAETSTADLVRELVGDALPPELVQRIVGHAGGNPLFVEELLRMWVGSGVLANGGKHGWLLAAEPESVELPPTVHAIYAGQLDDLPTAARRAARRAAVAGRRFPRAAFGPLGVTDADEALETLVRRALVEGPLHDEALGATFVYRHALLRDAGYASLSKGERAVLHCRLAEWLTSFPDDAASSLAEVIARHYATAADSAPALVREVDGRSLEEVRALAAGWFERAAEAALRVAAWESARELATRSLGDDVQGATRGRRLRLLAEATINALGADAAMEQLDEALAVYREAAPRDPEAAAAGIGLVGRMLGDLLRAQTRFAEARLLADDLLREIGPDADAASRARLLVLRAVSILNASEAFDEAGQDARAALDLARAAGDRSLELDVEQLLAQIAAERGADTALASWQRIEELGREQGRWTSVAAAMRMQGSFLIDDNPEGALLRFEACAELAAARGLVEDAAWCDYGRAEAYFVGGSWDKALVAGLRAVEVGESHGFHRVVVRSWFVLLPIATTLGRRDVTERAHARFAARRGREPDSPYARIITTAAHLHLAAAGLEAPVVPDVTERLASFELEHGGPSWLAGIQTVVLAWIDAGKLDGVATALDLMAGRVAHGGSALARATEATLRAHLSSARGDLAAAELHAHRALAELDDRAPWWRAGAIRTLESIGRADGALLAEAAAIESRLGILA